MFAHPECACTRASLRQLHTLLAKNHSRVNATVVFAPTPASQRRLEQSANWRLARSMPGIAVRSDDGREAQRFAAKVSGQTLLYDPDGALRFAGGLTVARGHDGESKALQAIQSIIAQAHASPIDPVHFPTFGCALTAPLPTQLVATR